MILTQPLLNNYGCLLQNFALQRVLSKLEHSCSTYDIPLIRPPKYILFLSWLKTLFLFFIPGKKRPFLKLQSEEKRTPQNDIFVRKELTVTSPMKKYSSFFVKQNKFDALIVGSDQVWRPKYNYRIKDMFLKFVNNLPIKRVAYAASFGVDSWEFSSKQTRVCSRLVKKFNAVSVREESGVKLCKDYLGVEATWVLDPTLLLQKDDYAAICEDVPTCKEKYLAVYVLDENEQVKAIYQKEAAARKLIVKKIYAGPKSTLTVPEWLAMFRDASYVVTDSFHGTVFSIIFKKEFKSFYNRNRGSARFESLLKLYHSGKLEEMREFSINWLKKALEN